MCVGPCVGCGSGKGQPTLRFCTSTHGTPPRGHPRCFRNIGRRRIPNRWVKTILSSALAAKQKRSPRLLNVCNHLRDHVLRPCDAWSLRDFDPSQTRGGGGCNGGCDATTVIAAGSMTCFRLVPVASALEGQPFWEFRGVWGLMMVRAVQPLAVDREVLNVALAFRGRQNKSDAAKSRGFGASV